MFTAFQVQFPTRLQRWLEKMIFCVVYNKKIANIWWISFRSQHIKNMNGSAIFTLRNNVAKNNSNFLYPFQPPWFNIGGEDRLIRWTSSQALRHFLQPIEALRLWNLSYCSKIFRNFAHQLFFKTTSTINLFFLNLFSISILPQTVPGLCGRLCDPSQWDSRIWGWLMDRGPP